MQGFTVIDLVILIVYLAAVLFAGLHFAKKEMKGKEYFKGDGTVPWWVTSVYHFSETLLSPISFLSLAGNSYAGTWIMWFAQLGMLLAIPVTIRFFLPIYSKLDIDTAYHYLELRFNSKGLRVLGAVMFIVYQIGRLCYYYVSAMYGSGRVAVINVNILIIIMGVIAIIYSYTGGLKSVLWTDFIQGSVLLIGVTFGLIFLISNIDGGIGAIFHEFSANHKFLAENQPIFDANILKDSVFLLIVGAGFNLVSLCIQSGYCTAFYNNYRHKEIKQNDAGKRRVVYLYCNRILSDWNRSVCVLSGTGKCSSSGSAAGSDFCFLDCI